MTASAKTVGSSCLRSVDIVAIRQIIRRDHGIRLRPVSEAGLGGVRASPHLFNTEDEVDRLIEVLGELL